MTRPRFILFVPCAIAAAFGPLAAGCHQAAAPKPVSVPVPASSSGAISKTAPDMPPAAPGETLMPPPPLPVGTPAPAFTTRTVTGKTLSLASLRGQVVLLDFWATWCGPCHMAMPTLNSLQRTFHPQGFTVVGMSTDGSDSIAKVKPDVRAMHLSYPITASVAANVRARKAYHVVYIPSQLLIDRKGIVRWSQSGYTLDEGEELKPIIRKLLAEH